MAKAAAVYHVGEGDAPLEVLHFFRKHFQGRVWNKDAFPVFKSLQGYYFLFLNVALLL